MKANKEQMTSSEMYVLFKRAYSAKVLELKESIRVRNNQITLLEEKFDKMRAIIERNIHHVDYDALKYNYHSKMKTAYLTLNAEIAASIFEDAKTLKELRESIAPVLAQIDYIRTRLLTLDITDFNQILRAFNIEVRDTMIRTGYIYNFSSRVKLRIVVKRQVRRSVDRQKSNQIKAQLIEQGLPLYNKETNPEGRKWIVFYDKDETVSFSYLPGVLKPINRNLFYFQPTTDFHNGASRVLYRYIRDNPTAKLNYVGVTRNKDKNGSINS